MAFKQHAHRGDDIAEIRAVLVDRAGDLAQHLLGASNVKLSSRREPRWGNHGSFSVIVDGPKAGVWRDRETNEAGDLLGLIMREQKCDFGSALKFGREFIGGHFVRPSDEPQRPQLRRVEQAHPVDQDMTEVARRIWRESVDPRGTVVERYLASRELPLIDEIAGSLIRFHARLYYSEQRRYLPGMAALMRDVRTNHRCAIIRTFFEDQGHKIDRKMPGPTAGAAIKLDVDASIEQGLHVGEGVETGIAAMDAGYRPVWATGSAGGIAKFPVLSGIDALTVLGETNDNGANERAVKEVAARWHLAKREVFVIEMLTGDDLNDAWWKAAP